MSVKRTGCLGQLPQYSKGSEGTSKSNSGQKNRQRDDGELVEGVQGLSIRRDERPSPHRAVPSGNRPSRSHSPTHASTRPAKQNSSRTVAAPHQLPSKPLQGDLRHPTFAADQPATYLPPRATRTPPPTPPPRASTGVRRGGVKKVTGRAREGYQHAPPAPRKGLRSGAIPFEIRLIINSGNDGLGPEDRWALFLHRNGRNKILSDVVGGPGEYRYRERRGVDPDPNNQLQNMRVAQLEPIHLDRYLEIVTSTPVNEGSRQWALGIVNFMIQDGLININFQTFLNQAMDH
jgi:hypothetical protein